VLNLLNLLAAVALLVWGTHIVRTGVLRVWGAGLRRTLSRSMGNRFKAALAGMGVTSLVQSSTATALLTGSFVGQGLIALPVALAIMLGADVGTAVIVQILSFDLSWLSPLLIFVGVMVFLSRRNARAGQIGRVAIGLGLMILALQLIATATRPIIEAAGAKVLFANLTGDILLDMVIGALFAILSYSSLAVVLLTATLVASGVIGTSVGMALVLGANLGSGMLAVLTTLGASPETRRVPLGNLVFKGLGCVLMVPFLGYAEQWLWQADASPARLIVNFHLVFNLLLAATFLFLVDRVARLTERLLPSAAASDHAGTPRHLDPVALQTPTLAIGCAAREALRIGDVIQDMLEGLLAVIRTNDARVAESLRRMDDTVDQLYTAVKLYLTQISREALEEREGQRWAEIMQFTINMEHAGDILERVVGDVVDKKISKGLSFSDQGMAEIEDLHARLMTNLRLGLSVFLHGDLKSAQQLIAEKGRFRELELKYADTHLHRLAGNTVQSIETSSLHLDLISDLKRINSLFCAIGYPILETAGELAPTRLRTQHDLEVIEGAGSREAARGGRGR
jgi:phosphate:Na+ symporter